jgi:hypothetical protein
VVIEYQDAVRAAPGNPALQWKLAKAVLKGGDARAHCRALHRPITKTEA